VRFAVAQVPDAIAAELVLSSSAARRVHRVAVRERIPAPPN